jgi:antitoxin component YwqK of YwqJK toxin-antitoxin module
MQRLLLVTVIFLFSCTDSSKHSFSEHKNDTSHTDKIAQKIFKTVDTNDTSLHRDTVKINVLNSKGQKEGLWRKYYRNGKVSEELNYKDGICQGLFRSYYPNGNIHVETIFINGKNDKYYKNFYPDGKLEGLATFKDCVIQRFERYDKKGKVIHYEVYENGKEIIENGDTFSRVQLK